MNKLYIKFYEEQTRVLDEQIITIQAFTEDKYVYYDPPYYKLKPNILIGRLDHKRTFGFLRQEIRDIYIDGNDLSDAMHDDIVFVIDGNDPKVDHVIKRALKQVVLTAKKQDQKLIFSSDVYFDRALKVSYTTPIVEGHVCLGEVQKITKDTIEIEVKDIIGHINDPDIETLKIVSSYAWPQTFSDELMNEVHSYKNDIDSELTHRVDLTDSLVFTIDGADAKDLDDAISLKMIDGMYHLGVHIADVSHYVRKDTMLDDIAYERATSVYLADRVIPMLPHILSNDWCSLNPKEIKLTLSCFMILDESGKMVSYEIKKTFIKSKFRLTYDQVNAFLIDFKSLGDKTLDETLLHMNELSQKLKKIRHKRGEIEFRTTELGFKVDQDGKVLDIYERKTDEAEALIESFMLVANETVAFHMHHSDLPSIYRVHEKPDLDKLRNALETVAQLGISVSYKQLGQAKPLQVITKNTLDSPYQTIIHNLILRAMQKAKYSATLDIHFGLGARYYTHFTSPIRRYPDLILHRLIHLFVLGEANDYPKEIKHFESIMHEIGQHTSDQERKAVQLERDVAKLKSCEFMQDKIGSFFKAMITQMMPSGMFVKLHNGIEGFVPLSKLDDYYKYEPSLLAYIGHRGLKYKLGDEVNVELLSVDIMDRKLDFKIKPIKGKKKGPHYENYKSKQKSKA